MIELLIILGLVAAYWIGRVHAKQEYISEKIGMQCKLEIHKRLVENMEKEMQGLRWDRETMIYSNQITHRKVTCEICENEQWSIIHVDCKEIECSKCQRMIQL